MRLPNKFNGYSRDGVRLYNDPASRASKKEADAKKAAEEQARLDPYKEKQLTSTYNTRVKEHNTNYANKLKDLNTDYTNRIKDTQKEYQNRIRDLQKEFSQRTKDEDAELRSIKNSKERAEKQKEFNEARKNRAAELSSLQKEMPTRIAALQKELKTAQTSLNQEKAGILKDLATAFNDTKAYAAEAIKRGENPDLEFKSAKQRQQEQQEQMNKVMEASQAQQKAYQDKQAALSAQFQKEAEDIGKQRQGENYTQMYDFLTQNMPAPAGMYQAQQFQNAPMAQNPAEQARMQGLMSALGQGQPPQGMPGMPPVYGPPQGMPGMPPGYGPQQGIAQAMPQPAPVAPPMGAVPNAQQPVSMNYGGYVRNR